jgi:hypothetical protein
MSEAHRHTDRDRQRCGGREGGRLTYYRMRGSEEETATPHDTTDTQEQR